MSKFVILSSLGMIAGVVGAKILLAVRKAKKATPSPEPVQ